jgi:hypothetical protein
LLIVLEVAAMDGTIINKGLLTYNKGVKNHGINIGDYIQSLAARSFYDTIDIYLDREELNNHNRNNRTKIILNGWFMHNPNNWPPSDNIIPKIISFHIYPNNAAVMLGYDGINYLKKHGPVGCRDYWTKTLLDKYGIPCYFSGCLTLTLGRKYQEKEKDGKIYFVDIHILLGIRLNIKRLGMGTLLSYIPIILFAWHKIMKIHKKQKRRIIHAALFYCLYQKMFTDDILTNCEFITHGLFSEAEFPNDEKRFEYAEELIKKYARAGLVVTTRLHSALPCLGLETPVVFMTNTINDERFGGLQELLRVMRIGKKGLETEDEILKNIKGKISGKTKLENKQEYKLIKEKLEKVCKEFMND